MDILELRRPQLKAVERSWTVALPRPHGRAHLLSAQTMSAAEQMFFFGAPLAHVVQYEERLKVMRQDHAARRLIRARGPHNLVRGLTAPLPASAARAD